MSVLTILVPLVIAVLAALIRAAILGSWAARSLAADFFFALAIVLLPLVVHA